MKPASDDSNPENGAFFDPVPHMGSQNHGTPASELPTRFSEKLSKLAITAFDVPDPEARRMVREIGENLRSVEREEARLLGGGTHDWGAVADMSKDTFVYTMAGKPVFAFGTTEVVPGVRHVWGIGTPEAHKVLHAVTRFIRDRYVPSLYLQGIRRVQVHVPLGVPEAWGWLCDHVGFRIETAMEGYCIDGSPLLQLVYTRQDFERTNVSEPQAP